MPAERTVVPVEPAVVPALLRRNREHLGSARAIVGDDRTVTHAELDDESRALAARLVAAGVGPASRVGLLAPNGAEWVVIAAAVMRVGAVLVPLSTLLRPPELLEQVQVAAVTHLLACREFRGRRQLDELEQEVPGLVATVVAGRRHAAVPSLHAAWYLDEVPDAVVDPELVIALEDRVVPADDLVVLFTSGSRGRPKGVIHTHGGALRATAAGLEARCVQRGSIVYIPMPFFWVGGLGAGLLSVLIAGATLLTEAEPEPTRTLALLERERATLFRGWPDQAARLAAHPAFATADLSSLGDGSLGALLPADRRPSPGARANLFGMTESFGSYCGDHLDRDLPPEKYGSCGRPFAGVEVRIADPETGRPVVADEQGEIWLRGPNLLRGICGRERAEVFTRDGWYRTADLGRLDGDGYLWYAGRLDDMVKVKGATVYPSEVEAALRTVDGVRQAYVTDLDDGDGRRQVGALVVTDADGPEVERTVRQRLSSFKVPTCWLFADDPGAVPLLGTGKVDKVGLQRLLRDEGGPASHRAPRSERGS